MSQGTEDAQSAEELRESPVPRPADADGSPSGQGQLLGTLRRLVSSRRLQLGAVFLAGLIIGWLILGWWVWPVQWTNAMPWHLQPAYQERYVRLVAEAFWYSSDVRQAQEALEDWDPEQLAEVLKRAQQEAASEEDHDRIVALAEALTFPTYETSIWASLANEKAIVGGASLSVLLFAAAGVLAVYSFVQTKTEAPDEAAVWAGEPGERAAGEEEWTPGGSSEYHGEEGLEEGDGFILGSDEEDESEGDEEEDFYDAEEDFYEEGEDVVSSLSAFMFDEEEEDISQLKALCDRLPELDISELLEDARGVSDELGRGLELRSRESRF